MDVWVLTHLDCGGEETLGTLISVFSSLDNCKRYLAEGHLGQEFSGKLVWTAHNEGFWEAHEPDHVYCYACVRETPDHELADYG